MPGNPMVPPASTVWVIGYAEGYGATWVKVKTVDSEESGESPPPEPAPQ
jgi:hypothetical protein